MAGDREFRNPEDAVSPVVGVMLMLVVTIMIAAVVSAFTGGLWGNTDKAPVSTLQAKISVPNHTVTLTHIGGDPFLVRDIKVVVSNDTSSMVFSNNSATNGLYKNSYSNDESPGLIRAGDSMKGDGSGNPSFFDNNTEYRWSVIHIPSQKSVANGKLIP